MNSDNGARLSFFLNRMAEELVNELRAHQELITKLEEKIINLQQVADRQGEKIEELSQAGVKGYNATDLGNMVSEIERAGLLADYIDQRISEHPEVIGEEIVQDIARREAEEVLSDAGHGEDDIRQWAKEEAEEVLSNASFSVTVD